jgi:short-subunit dehydrogenase
MGERARARALDVTDASSVEAFVDDVESAIGPITLWVNNAGIMPTGPLAEQDLAVASAIIDVNYRGVVVCTRLILPRMLARGSGHIVNIASATATHPIAGLAVYSGTKAAVIGFSRALRRELRRTGIRVSVILPYLAATAMGAGIAAQPGFGRVTPEAVATRVVHAMRRGGLVHYVPGHLRLGVALINALPLPLRDLIDDLLKTDRIGLGGDASARAAYARDAADRGR